MEDDELERQLIKTITAAAEQSTPDQMLFLTLSYAVPYNTMLRDIPDAFFRVKHDEHGNIPAAEASALFQSVLDIMLGAIKKNEKWMRRIEDHEH